MRRQYFFVAAFLLLVGTMTSCEKDVCDKTVTYDVFVPQYLTIEELRTAVSFEDSRELINPGKLYLYESYLFINETAKGVHVYDNSDKSNPRNIGFINIPGNVDIGVRNGVLFADSYMDLVSIKLNGISDLEELDRETDIFPGTNWGTGLPLTTKGILTDYVLTTATETINCSSPDPAPQNYLDVNENLVAGEPPLANGGTDIPIWDDFGDTGGFPVDAAGGGFEGAPSAPSTGVAGSTARFGIVGSKLYAVSNSQLRVVDISNPTNLDITFENWVNWGTETIFPYRRGGVNYLFLGGQNGMEIYTVEDSGEVFWTGQFTHATSCDPVVVEGNYAYVTLRSGSFCQGFTNELDVIDVTNLNNPELIADYPMTNPHGLGIDDNTLFICDGEAGLKIYDATDKFNIDENLITRYEDINALDVIPWDNTLLMIGSDGFYQYDYNNLNDISLLSKIEVKSN